MELNMNVITITDRAKLQKMQPLATGDRATVIDALLTSKSDATSLSAILKIAEPVIDARNRKQPSEYIVRYYVSDLKRTFGAVTHDGAKGGRSALAQFAIKK